MAKRCTFPESRKSPAQRGFVAGRWVPATTSLYPSTKIKRPQRATNRAPRRRSSSGIECSGWPGLPRHDCLGLPPPHTRLNAAEIHRQGHRLHPSRKTGTQGPHGRHRGCPPARPSRAWAHRMPQGESGCGLLPAKGVWQPLAASQMLCLPHPRVGKIRVPRPPPKDAGGAGSLPLPNRGI